MEEEQKKKNKTKELEQSEWALHDNKWQGSILPWEFAAHLQDMRPNKQALSDKNANKISLTFLQRFLFALCELQIVNISAGHSGIF